MATDVCTEPVLCLQMSADWTRADVTAVVGSGEYGTTDGKANAAKLCIPHNFVLDTTKRRVLFTDSEAHQVRAWYYDINDNRVTTIAGMGRTYGDDSRGPCFVYGFEYQTAIAIDPADGSLLVSTQLNKIFRIDEARNRCFIAAGRTSDSDRDVGAGYADGTGRAAHFRQPLAMVCDSKGGLYVCDFGNCRIRRCVRAADGMLTVTTVAGNGQETPSDGKVTHCGLGKPCAIAIDPHNESILYVVAKHGEKSAIRIVNLHAGTMSSVVLGFELDCAQIAFDPIDRVLLATDGGLHVIRLADGSIVRKIEVDRPHGVLLMPDSSGALAVLVGSVGRRQILTIRVPRKTQPTASASSSDTKVVPSSRSPPVAEWGVVDVCAWFKSLGAPFEAYGTSFVKPNGVDGLVFCQLTDKALSDAGMTNSMHRTKVLTEIQRLKHAADNKASSIHRPADVKVNLDDLKSAKATITTVPKSDAQFDEADLLFRAAINGQHEDYNEHRIKKGLKPLTFRLLTVERVDNPTVSGRFERKVAALKAADRTSDEVKLKWAFHGTRESALHSIATYGLLRIGHSSGLNPSKSTDPGYFGDPKQGVYLSRYVEYALKYSNGLDALSEGESAKVVMFRMVSGRSLHVPKKTLGMKPTAGYDSHSSANFLEWYLFDETMCCPAYILTVKAFENRRTDADDAAFKG